MPTEIDQQVTKELDEKKADDAASDQDDGQDDTEQQTGTEGADVKIKKKKKKPKKKSNFFRSLMPQNSFVIIIQIFFHGMFQNLQFVKKTTFFYIIFLTENPEAAVNGLNIDGLNLNDNKKPSANKNVKKQTNPPTIPICELYPNGDFPVGAIHEYTVPKYMNE
jgi:hypothetical protein